MSRVLAITALAVAACAPVPSQPPVSGTATAVMTPRKPVHDARGLARVDGEAIDAHLGEIAVLAAIEAQQVRLKPPPPPVRYDAGILARIAQCESGGSYTARNSTSSAAGKYQFLTSTWQAWGDPRWPTAADAPPDVQEAAAQRLFAAMGTRPWNASRHCWG